MGAAKSPNADVQHGNLGKHGKDKCAVCAGGQRGPAATFISFWNQEMRI